MMKPITFEDKTDKVRHRHRESDTNRETQTQIQIYRQTDIHTAPLSRMEGNL